MIHRNEEIQQQCLIKLVLALLFVSALECSGNFKNVGSVFENDRVRVPEGKEND